MAVLVLVIVACFIGTGSTVPPPAIGCLQDGKWYAPGENFKMECNSCTCGENGVAACTLMGCNELPVTDEPIGCLQDGKWYAPGENFKMDCNSCTCGENGLASCTKMACVQKPVGCSHNGASYEDGESFKDKCNQCSCRNGLVACTKMACGNLAKRRSEPRLPNKCWFNGEFYDIGDSFKDADDCNTCWCGGKGETTYVACHLMACPTIPIN